MPSEDVVIDAVQLLQSPFLNKTEAISQQSFCQCVVGAHKYNVLLFAPQVSILPVQGCLTMNDVCRHFIPIVPRNNENSLT